MSDRERLQEGAVLVDLASDGVAHLTLNRPDASNGLNEDLMKALVAGTELLADPRVRCVLFGGAGANFCAGGDVKEFKSKGDGLPEYLEWATAQLAEAARNLIELNAPVIALVQGWAVGGAGLGLVCATDLAIGTESSRYMSGATRVGMAPDAGSTATLPQIVGVRKAMEIFLTDPVLSASDALELGILNQVVPDDGLDQAGAKLAAKFAAGPTLSYGETKRLTWQGLGRPLAESLPDECATVSRLSGTDDSQEGLAAVIEKRKPEYRGS